MDNCCKIPVTLIERAYRSFASSKVAAAWDLISFLHRPMWHLTLTLKFKEQIIVKAEVVQTEFAGKMLTPVLSRFW